MLAADGLNPGYTAINSGSVAIDSGSVAINFGSVAINSGSVAIAFSDYNVQIPGQLLLIFRPTVYELSQ